MKLYSYWRSTAAYRVRIALGLKGIDYDYCPVNLVRDGGEQHSAEYRTKNPQGLVPLLETDDGLISQSSAIIRYLDTKYPEPTVYSDDPFITAKIESFAQTICADIHPLNNLRVLNYLTVQLQHKPDAKQTWYHHWLTAGFEPLEAILAESDTDYALTSYPSLADICLVAQVFNARRFNFALTDFPNIVDLEQRCLALDAFVNAKPENQIDAE